MNVMGVLNTIEQKTSGNSFRSHKYCHDLGERGIVDYDDNKEVVWKEYGETEKLTRSVSLKTEADKRRGQSIFSFFLDGSRYTYKVDDMSFRQDVFPIIAGQVGVGCCERQGKSLVPLLPFEKKLVLALPDKAFSSDWDKEKRKQEVLEKINENIKIQFDDLLDYNTNKDEKFEKKGIAKIQGYMIELEKRLVADLAAQGKLDEDHYLIKDGSLEYQESSVKNKNALNLSNEHIRNNYRRVIGVSKSFDPTKCLIKKGGTNSKTIADLELYERTPAYRYESTRAGADFCIWYLRIRKSNYTHSVFDGILKIERLIVTEKERVNGIETDDINSITAFLINERNPVCYGADLRWANHLYPVYLTERYIKSKYLSHDLFMQLF
jgi:hypothetical protein